MRHHADSTRVRAWSKAEAAPGQLPAPLDRVLTVGLALAVTAVSLQTLAHLLNAAFDGGRGLDANAEQNAMTWASSSATFAAAFLAGLCAVLLDERRRAWVLLASIIAFFSLDDAILLHERLAQWVLALFGQDTSWDSLLWPALYLPLAGIVVVLLLSVTRTAPGRARRFLLVGLALLLTAVAAEALSAPVSTPETAGGWAHTLEGAYEEGAELAGWILIATGLTVSTLSEPGRLPGRA